MNESEHYRGISDWVAADYLERHGQASWHAIGHDLQRGPNCPKLKSYWHFHDCRYSKKHYTCAVNFLQWGKDRHPHRGELVWSCRLSGNLKAPIEPLYEVPVSHIANEQVEGKRRLIEPTVAQPMLGQRALREVLGFGALGRSRGGFSTKIHLKVDLDGLPLAFHLTGGEASDSRNFELLLDIGPDILPRAAITDKGYDAKSNRDGARKRGICPVIPHRATATDRPAFFPKILYKARARIEQAVGKLKRFKRIALRCEKTARNYGSFVALALGLILIKSVHTA